MSYTIFISYAKEDVLSARKLYLSLQEAGFNPWLDEQNIFPGQEWQAEISHAIRSADIVLVCLSRRAITKRGYFQKEIRLALDIYNEIPEGDIYLIPIRLEEVMLPDQFSHVQWVDIFHPDGFERLVFAITYQLDKLRKQQVGFYSRKPAILLDFKTATDPIALLQSLIIFQNTHDTIYIGQHNLLAIEWLEEPGGPSPLYIDLSDLSYLENLEDYHGYASDDLRLLPNNLPLALRILQFAIEEGFIKVEVSINHPLLSELVSTKSRNSMISHFRKLFSQYRDTDYEIANNESLSAIRTQISKIPIYGPGISENRKWSGGFLLTPCYIDPDWLPSANDAQFDLSLCLKKNYHLVVDGRINDFNLDLELPILLKDHTSLYQETINLVQPTKFYDYQKMIEIAGIFPQIVNKVQSKIDQQQDFRSLHSFIPRLDSSGNMSGTFNYTEILHSIIRRNVGQTQRE